MNLPNPQAADQWASAQRIAIAVRWDSLWQSFTHEATRLLVQALPASTARVLDLASGAGDPALHIAKALAPAGQVVATDLGGDILGVAAKTAEAMGITNLTFREADAQSLPFADGHFDAVTCRFGVMFFPDAVGALRECARVLQPGGVAVFVVWGPMEQNTYFAATVSQVLKFATVSPPGPDAPHPFRFAAPGTLRRAFETAGFTRVGEQVCPMTLTWPGPPEQLWQYFLETTGSYRPHLESLSAGDLALATFAAQAEFHRHFDGNGIPLRGEVVLATGIRE